MKQSKKAVTNKNNLKRKSSQEISFKNYFYAFIVLVGGIFFVLFSFKWFQAKNQERLNTSYLITSNTLVNNIANLEEFKHISQELPSSYFIYLGYTGDENVYNLEKEIKPLIDRYNLNDILYYIDVTDLKNKDKDYINTIKNDLNINNLEKVPAIIYVVDGEILESNVLDGVKNTNLKAEDLEQLLLIYDFEESK